MNVEQISIRRSKDGAPLAPEPRQRFNVTGNTVQLALDNVQKQDAGMYTVTAKSTAAGGGSAASRDIELRVDQHIIISGNDDEPPAFLRRLNDLSIKVGTRTRFLVEIRSSSEIAVSMASISF